MFKNCKAVYWHFVLKHVNMASFTCICVNTNDEDIEPGVSKLVHKLTEGGQTNMK